MFNFSGILRSLQMIKEELLIAGNFRSGNISRKRSESVSNYNNTSLLHLLLETTQRQLGLSCCRNSHSFENSNQINIQMYNLLLSILVEEYFLAFREYFQ